MLQLHTKGLVPLIQHQVISAAVALFISQSPVSALTQQWFVRSSQLETARFLSPLPQYIFINFFFFVKQMNKHSPGG